MWLYYWTPDVSVAAADGGVAAVADDGGGDGGGGDDGDGGCSVPACLMHRGSGLDWPPQSGHFEVGAPGEVLQLGPLLTLGLMARWVALLVVQAVLAPAFAGVDSDAPF